MFSSSFLLLRRRDLDVDESDDDSESESEDDSEDERCRLYSGTGFPVNAMRAILLTLRLTKQHAQLLPRGFLRFCRVFSGAGKNTKGLTALSGANIDRPASSNNNIN